MSEAQPAARPTRVAPPRLIAWELTRRCPLACKHCRADAHRWADPDELSAEEARAVLAGIAAFARPILILTGGEPLLRKDVYALAAEGTRRGLRVVLASCGAGLDDAAAERLARSGVRAVSISLDGATPASHDAFRGVDGAFAMATRGLAAAVRAGLDVQVNTTVTRDNAAELPELLALARRLRAGTWNPFLLVATGRGRQLGDRQLDPEAYERTLRWLAEREADAGIRLRVTCAPQYQRVRLQVGRPADDRPGPQGCLGGQSYAFISARGIVQPCGFLDLPAGDLRTAGLDLRSIWEGSELFARLRDRAGYGGRCGQCEYLHVCGGCRARAYAAGGDALAEEPFCAHEPHREDHEGRQQKRLHHKGHKGQKGPGPGADGGTNDTGSLWSAAALSPLWMSRGRDGSARARRAKADARATGQAAEMDEVDRRVLGGAQRGLPIEARPFDALGARLGLSGEVVLERLGRLRADGVLRRVGPVFDAAHLGYATALIAAQVPPEQLEAVAAAAADLGGVSHNYQRDHAYNLWFTLSRPSLAAVRAAAAGLAERTGAEMHVLPAERTYKVRVAFPLDERVPGPASPAALPAGDAAEAAGPSAVPAGGQPVRLNEADRALVRHVQDGVELVAEPFALAAEAIGRAREDVLATLRGWRAAGVVRRFGAVVAHRRLGVRANGLVLLDVPAERIDAAGAALAAHDEVTHCFRRPPLPGLGCRLYVMLHGRSREAVRARAAELAEAAGARAWHVLFSTRAFRRAPLRYFEDHGPRT